MKTKAFTLVELLVVMVLISILSSMTAVMLSGAKTQALEKKTQREIDVIEQILLTRISDMGFSPVPLILPVVNSAATQDAARVRLMARRDQMRMVFPDRRADLLHPPTRLRYYNGTTFSSTKIRPPAAWTRMRTKLGLDRPAVLPTPGTDILEGDVLPGGSFEAWGLRLVGDTTTHVVPDSTANPELPAGTSDSVLQTLWTLEHESAECLYLILAVTELNGTPALDLLGHSYIANTDGDIVPEIVDAWGQPLGFVRWPIGAPFGDIQSAGPDAFDYLRSDHRFQESTTAGSNDTTNDPINLTPMIVSAGPDGELGIRLTNSDDQSVSRNFSFATTLYTGSTLGTSPSAPYLYPDPYYNAAGSDNDIIAARAGGGLGAAISGKDAVDNITNFGG